MDKTVASPGTMLRAAVAELGEADVAYAYQVQGRVAGLERTARLAGEAFGHEDAVPLSVPGFGTLALSRFRARLSAGVSSMMMSLAPGAR